MSSKLVFKNSNRDPIVLFHSYRVMYLRQFLLNNHSNLFSENKLVKKLSIDSFFLLKLKKI